MIRKLFPGFVRERVISNECEKSFSNHLEHAAGTNDVCRDAQFGRLYKRRSSGMAGLETYAPRITIIRILVFSKRKTATPVMSKSIGTAFVPYFLPLRRAFRRLERNIRLFLTAVLSGVVFQLMAQSSSGKLHLLFFGDLMLHGQQLESAYHQETGTYTFDEVFRYIAPYLSAPDFCIGNLEVPLGVKPYRGYPLFGAPPGIAGAAKRAGVDVLVTANNHAADRRNKGIERSIQILDSTGILHTGTFAGTAEKQLNYPLMLEKNGIRVALYNATYGTNGIPVPPPAIVNTLGDGNLLRDILVDYHVPDSIFKIAFLHWGLEYRDLPTGKQKTLAGQLFDAGIHLVTGSHPHVIEPMEYDSISRKGVVYSLGNFVSNQRKTRTSGGAMVLAVLSAAEGHTQLVSLHYLLVWVYKKPREDGRYMFYVLPADEFSFKPSFFDNNGYRQMLDFISHSRKLLHTHNRNVREYRPYTEAFLSLFAGEMK